MSACTDDSPPPTTDTIGNGVAAARQKNATSQLPNSPTALANRNEVGSYLVRFAYVALIALEVLVLFYDNVPISVQVLTTAVLCIFLGSFGSLSAAETDDVERLKPKDAYLFPVFGSMALCSFYLCIKYLPKYMLDVAAQIFFVLMSSFAVQALLDELAALFLPAALFAAIDIKMIVFVIEWKNIFTIPVLNKPVFVPKPSFVSAAKADTIDRKKENQDVVDMTTLNLCTLAMGSVVAYFWYAWDQYWLFNNMIGISLSIQAISFLNPGSYYTATVLLCLLFFYDIFWVFGTDVMVTVAKNLKAPIKLIFPRPAVSDKPNMLGLGDIVLPGIYVALLLRYDIQRSFKDINFKNLTQKTIASAPKLLNFSTFYACLVCYFLSLLGCLVTMWVFEAAQPALLYIVPGVIAPIIGMTYLRGDFNALWEYDEEPEAEKNKKDN